MHCRGVAASLTGRSLNGLAVASVLAPELRELGEEQALALGKLNLP